METIKYRPITANTPIEQNPKPKINRYQKLDELFSYIKLKVEALLWILVFAFIYHKTEIVKEIFTNPKISHGFLLVFKVTVGINFVCCLYVLYITYYLKIKNYDEYSTFITPVAAVSVLISFFSFIVVIFPIYGFKSFLIAPFLSFGFMMISHFIPFKGELNTLTLFLIFLGLIYFGYHFY